MLKRIFASKLFRYGLSAVLIYFAFRRIDFNNLVSDLSRVPVWFILFSLFYLFLVMVISAYRWSLILFKRPDWSIVWNFTKAGYTGAFYSLLFPTQLAGDLLKWIPLQKHYPSLTRAKLLSSSLVDRIIGFSAFITVAFASSIIGRALNISFPDYLLILFSGLFFSVVSFFILLFNFPIENLLGRIPLVKQTLHLVDLIRRQDRKRLFYVYIVALLTEFTWITPVWFYSLITGAGMSLVSIYIFMPIIGLILVLPISIAGLGAREQLFLFFFSQVDIPAQKILLVSAMTSLFTLITNLIGGLFLIF